MQAVRIHRFGGPEVIAIEEIDGPAPAANEVLIKVFAASVNPVDAKMREGKYPVVTERDLPYVLGRDVSGRIEAKGDDVFSVQVGDEVFAFLSPEHGGYAEFVLARADEVAAKPRSLDAIAAAAVPLAGITAWQGLFDHGGLQPGQRVLIHGGAGGVGHFAIQFAKAKGAWVATTVSSDDTEFVRDLGADQVIDYKAEKFENRAEPVDLVFDLIGGETQERSFSVVKPGGALISTLQEPDKRKAKRLNIRVSRYTAQPSGAELQEIAALIDQGKVKVVVDATFGLRQVAEAQAALEEKHIRGKVVLKVVEQPQTAPIDEEARRLRAYQIWENEGRPEGEDLAHWYKAGDVDASATAERADYQQYVPGATPAGSLVIKFYHSGDQVRGYVRKIADPGTGDTIFPGEEMEPEAAFKLADSHNYDHKPIFIELVEGIEWDAAWGRLE
ncbi:NADPH:quinone reductase-like Zn-dependent oxidoreductase [Rhizobium sp. BK512]|uniref:zinc-binding dehydrogenase n=1 Tax=Rhizobium sp. BK512 TaxID=2587010 RepID=UPI00161EB851|nr:zinc-binding dehydrogenase [Rhizobium sp. BK512]MBB3565834.1 NADPH:quinone reductase-like Zn-dependent oxidoreductase [Rhizobium sp. BK512]